MSQNMLRFYVHSECDDAHAVQHVHCTAFRAIGFHIYFDSYESRKEKGQIQCPVYIYTHDNVFVRAISNFAVQINGVCQFEMDKKKTI